VTDEQNSTPSAPEKVQASLCGFPDAAELLKVRILPAEFARLLGVSKQAVSRWIAAGKLSINTLDGRLEVQSGVQQVLRNCDPGRLRARWLRAAVADVQALRLAAAEADERVAEVEARLGAELVDARARIARLESYALDADCMLDTLLGLLRDSELAMRATADSDEWCELVGRIESAAADACDPEGWAAADALDALTARDFATPEGGGE
jgi:hypothetical protein